MPRDAAAALGDFYAGLETALTTLLLSPEFLFRVEVAEPDPNAPQRQRLTAASMASRLSYFLWNTTPDEELLAAAERGELVDDAGLARQVDRLLASPRLEAAVRAFFSDWYGFDEIEEGLVRKDPTLFPAFSQALINDAREQTLRVITDHLLDRGRRLPRAVHDPPVVHDAHARRRLSGAGAHARWAGSPSSSRPAASAPAC